MMDCEDLKANIAKNRSYDEEVEAAEDEQRRHAELDKLLDLAINITDFMSDQDDSDNFSSNYDAKTTGTNENTSRSFFREYTTNLAVVQNNGLIAQHPYLTNEDGNDICKKTTKEKSNRIISVAPNLSISNTSICQKETLDIFDNQHIKDLYEARVDEVLSLQIELQNVREANNVKSLKIVTLQENITKLTESLETLEKTSKELIDKLQCKDDELIENKICLEEVQRDLTIAQATIENLQHEIVQNTISSNEIPFSKIQEIQRPKDEEIRRLHLQMADKDTEIDYLKTKVKEMSQALEQASMERVEHVVSLSRKIKDLEQSVHNPIALNQIMQEKDVLEARMKILEENLSKIHEQPTSTTPIPNVNFANLNYNLIMDELKRSLQLIEKNCLTIKNLQSRSHEDAATIEKLRSLLAKKPIETKNSSTNVSQVDMKNTSVQNTFEEDYIADLRSQNESLTHTIKTLQNYEIKYQQQIALLQSEFDSNQTKINDLKLENLELKEKMLSLSENNASNEKLLSDLNERNAKIEILEEKIRKRNDEYVDIKRKLRETEEEFLKKVQQLEKDKASVEQENVKAIKELVELRYVLEQTKQSLNHSSQSSDKKVAERNIVQLNNENLQLKEKIKLLDQARMELQDLNEVFATKIIKQSTSLKDLAVVNNQLLNDMGKSASKSDNPAIKKLESLNTKLVEKLHKGKHAIMERNTKLLELQSVIQQQQQQIADMKHVFSEEINKKLEVVFSRLHISKKSSEIVAIIRDELEKILDGKHTFGPEKSTCFDKYWNEFAENSRQLHTTSEKDDLNKIIDSQLLILKKIKTQIESGHAETLWLGVGVVDDFEAIYNSFNEYVARYFYLKMDKKTLESQYEKMASEFFQLQRVRCNDETVIHNLRLKEKINSLELDLLHAEKIQKMEKIKNLEQVTSVRQFEQKNDFLETKIHKLESQVAALRHELNDKLSTALTCKINSMTQTEGDFLWKNILKKQKKPGTPNLKGSVSTTSGLIKKKKTYSR